VARGREVHKEGRLLCPICAARVWPESPLKVKSDVKCSVCGTMVQKDNISMQARGWVCTPCRQKLDRWWGTSSTIQPDVVSDAAAGSPVIFAFCILWFGAGGILLAAGASIPNPVHAGFAIGCLLTGSVLWMLCKIYAAVVSLRPTRSGGKTSDQL
jgi:DNA-directed RNA polymerase subunit RPC12/RpoP